MGFFVVDVVGCGSDCVGYGVLGVDLVFVCGCWCGFGWCVGWLVGWGLMEGFDGFGN